MADGMKVFAATPQKHSSIKKVLVGFGVACALLITVGIVSGIAGVNGSEKPRVVAATPQAAPSPAPVIEVPAVEPPRPPEDAEPPKTLARLKLEAAADRRAVAWESEKREAETKRKAELDKAQADKEKEEQLKKDRAEMLSKSEGLIRQLTESGALKKYNGSSFWVDPIAWRVSDRDTKETCVRAFAAFCDLKTGIGRVATVKSYQDDTVFAETTWTGGVKIYH